MPALETGALGSVSKICSRSVSFVTILGQGRRRGRGEAAPATVRTVGQKETLQVGSVFPEVVQMPPEAEE